MKIQAKPEKTVFLDSTAFSSINTTCVRWLGAASAMVNARGTVLMIDPIMEQHKRRLLIEHPIQAENVPRLDGVLVTHCDADHFDPDTLQGLSHTNPAFHTTQYVASLMQASGIPGQGHEIGEQFQIGNVKVQLTPADHDWQNDRPNPERHYEKKDYCGFYLYTPDGTVWMPGDSRLMEEQLHFPEPDVILMDFSDNEYHIGLKDAVRFSEVYANAAMILIHWGTMDAPDATPYNGDPKEFLKLVHNPGRVHVMNPGEPFELPCRSYASAPSRE